MESPGFLFNPVKLIDSHLVGGFNPFEKYGSKWESSPNRDENRKCLKPLPSHGVMDTIIAVSWQSKPVELFSTWMPQELSNWLVSGV